jgi:TPR repeat protein
MERDTKLARIREAAEQGNPDAQFELGKRYELGDGVPRDFSAAYSWLQKAAQGGSRLAEQCLGWS